MPNEVMPPPRPQAITRIKFMMPRLPERGHIKIGRKGAVRKSQQGNEFQPPEKLDHFLITTMDRGSDNNFVRDEAIHKALGNKPTRIPIRLLYDDPNINFVSKLACYKGRTLWCTGDGETASRVSEDGKSRVQVGCPCERSAAEYSGSDKCKFNGSLQCVIDIPDALGVGGIWRFRTTSYNSVADLTGGLEFMSALTGGVMAGIPLDLVLAKKQATDPRGKAVTIYTVSLDARPGVGPQQLRDMAKDEALNRATHRINIAQIEDRARQILALPAPDGVILPGDDAEEVRQEFYNQEVPAQPTRAEFTAGAETIDNDSGTEEGGAAQSEIEDALAMIAAQTTTGAIQELSVALSEVVMADGAVMDAYDARYEVLRAAEAQAAEEAQKKATATTPRAPRGPRTPPAAKAPAQAAPPAQEAPAPQESPGAHFPPGETDAGKPGSAPVSNLPPATAKVLAKMDELATGPGAMKALADYWHTLPAAVTDDDVPWNHYSELQKKIRSATK